MGEHWKTNEKEKGRHKRLYSEEEERDGRTEEALINGIFFAVCLSVSLSVCLSVSLRHSLELFRVLSTSTTPEDGLFVSAFRRESF